MTSEARTTTRARPSPLRIGVLGAARITPNAVLVPAAANPDVEVVAVAARDEVTARRFAEEHGIGRVLPDYEALLADPEVDVVYNPLPNGLHGRWTIAAIEAGKHVLCEKPFAANAEEARRVADVAAGTDRVVMEAFHYRYHALVARLIDVLASGRLGEVRRVDAFFRAHLGPASDIRWQPGLAPGAMMDLGTYPLHLMRTLTGEEPEVVAAEALTRSPGVERTLRADLRFPGGVEGRLSTSMLSRWGTADGVDVVGTRGRLRVRGFVGPQGGNRVDLRWRAARGRHRVERSSFTRHPTSYAEQLAALVAAIHHGTPYPTDPEDAVRQMAAIDACYRAAGLEPREPAA